MITFSKLIDDPMHGEPYLVFLISSPEANNGVGYAEKLIPVHVSLPMIGDDKSRLENS